ncbi:uncharacterized protein LOC122282373 [Carya illinoinensis]|uniref:uncharacterized protein LOC122282373 n=1 Tax=Carya illinoinensis TaxID=32201 RepID=UPI001C728089|nr:uncharacterized protein LOC122282373 [Carya illinoinensis]
MSSSPDQTFDPHPNTHPVSSTKNALIALNITAPINEKLTPSTFPQWRAQFQALLIGYNLLDYVNGIFHCPSTVGTSFTELNKTHWRGNRSIPAYLHEVKALAIEIALINHPISDNDLTLYILNGLGSNFREIAAPIQTWETFLAFEELYDILVGHESYLRHLETANQ